MQAVVLAAADAVVGAIDAAELAIFLAQKCAEEGPGTAQRKKGACGGDGEGGDGQQSLLCPGACLRCVF